MDLAGEGLTLTQWNPAAQQAEEWGEGWLLPWSGAEGERPLAQGGGWLWGLGGFLYEQVATWITVNV